MMAVPQAHFSTFPAVALSPGVNNARFNSVSRNVVVANTKVCWLLENT